MGGAIPRGSGLGERVATGGAGVGVGVGVGLVIGVGVGVGTPTCATISVCDIRGELRAFAIVAAASTARAAKMLRKALKLRSKCQISDR